MAILQTTTIVTSGAGPVKVPGSSPLGAETVTDSILECVSDQIQEVNNRNSFFLTVIFVFIFNTLKRYCMCGSGRKKE